MTKEVKKEKAKKPHYVDNKVFLAAMMEWKDEVNDEEKQQLLSGIETTIKDIQIEFVQKI